MFAAIDSLEFPELHDESIPAISFLRHLGRLMTASGIRDFSVKVRGVAWRAMHSWDAGTGVERECT